jgi:hypothetical protein
MKQLIGIRTSLLATGLTLALAPPALAQNACTVEQITAHMDRISTTGRERFNDTRQIDGLCDVPIVQDTLIIDSFASLINGLSLECKMLANPAPNMPRPLACDYAAKAKSVPFGLIAHAIVELTPQTRTCMFYAVAQSLPDAAADRCGLANDDRAVAYAMAVAMVQHPNP